MRRKSFYSKPNWGNIGTSVLSAEEGSKKKSIRVRRKTFCERLHTGNAVSLNRVGPRRVQ